MRSTQLQGLLEEWRARFSGELVSPEHESYETSRRIWNGMIDRKPLLIARCRTAADVVASVKFARSAGLHVSVRGGGHGVAGTAVCEDGLMIDLSPMKDVVVDAQAREVVAQPGVLWGELDKAAEAHGLATTGGQVSHTGIAGLTLGGGLGYLMGRFGAVCDNLLSVEMVTADGELVTASEESNPELFWAVRGAGANFGIATAFRYRLHPLPGVLAGLLLYPREQAEALIAFWQEWLPGTPDELTTTLGFLNAPDGSALVAIVAVWAGPVDEGERVLKPLRSFGQPIADLIQPMPYTAAQQLVDGAVPAGNRYYWKSNFLDRIDPALARLLKEGADGKPSPLSMVLVFEIKGAVRRVPKDAMAFEHRDAKFEMSIIAEWTDPADDARNIAWARDLWTRAQPFVSNAVYANHMTADEPEERVRSAYGAEKYAKLAELKARYDPANVFCQNHNIRPMGGGLA